MMCKIEDEINDIFSEYEDYFELFDTSPIDYILNEEWDFVCNRIKSNLTGGKKPAAE